MANPGSFLEDHYRKQQSRYTERLLQARICFYLAIFLLVIGALIILAGFGYFLLIVKSPLGGSIAAGAGAISGILGRLILKFHNDVNTRLDQTAQELQSLASHVDWLSNAERYINQITDPDRKNKALEDLARNSQKGPPRAIPHVGGSPHNQSSSGIIRAFVRKLF